MSPISELRRLVVRCNFVADFAASYVASFVVLRIEVGPNLVPPLAGDRLTRAFRQSQRAVAPGLRVVRQELDSSSSSSSPPINSAGVQINS